MQGRLIAPGERELFNGFVASHPKGHVLQSFEWGEIKAKTGWDPLRLIIEEDGQIKAAISILKRRIPGVGKYIFYAPRGPVCDLHDRRVFDFLLEEVRKLAKEHGAIFLKLDPDVPHSDQILRDYLKEKGFRSAEKGEGFEGIQPKFVFRLDISPDEEAVFNSFHSKTRYNIRLAAKKGVTIKTDCTKADLPAFYEVLKETTERDNFLVRSYSYFEDMYDYLVPAGMAKLFLAEFEGKVIAGTLALNIGEKAWYLYGASSNSYRNVMPNYLIQWTMIQWAKSLGCTLYDFRGVPGDLSEDNPLHGLYRFKKGFNGEYTQFVGEYDLVYSPALYTFWNVAEPLYYGGVRKLIGLVRGK